MESWLSIVANILARLEGTPRRRRLSSRIGLSTESKAFLMSREEHISWECEESAYSIALMSCTSASEQLRPALNPY